MTTRIVRKLPPSMRVPKYRLHKGSGQALVQWRGQRIYLGVHGTPESKRKYREFIAKLLRAADAPAASAPVPAGSLSGATVADLLAKFLHWAEGYYVDQETGQTTNEYAMLSYAVQPVFQLHARQSLEQFGPSELKSTREEMIRLGWSRTHINHQVQRLRRVFRWGVEHDIVPPGALEALRAVAPLKKGRTPARETSPIRPADDFAVNAIMAFLSPQVAAMVQLQRVTGMRSQNVCRMRPSDLSVALESSTGLWVYVPDRHKTTHLSRALTIYLGPAAQAILRPIVARRRPDDFVFSPEESVREHRERRRASRKTKVQPSQADRSIPFPAWRPGRRFTTASYRRAIRRAIDAYNATQTDPQDRIEKWTPHRLRHARGTEVRSRYGLEAAQAALGHARADVTQLYAERDAELAAKVAREIG